MNKKKSLKTMYYYTFAFLTLFLCILYQFRIVYKNHRNTVVEQQNKQLSVIANTGANYLKTYMDEKNLEIQNLFNLRELGHDPEEIERKIEATIKVYWNQSPIYLDYMKYFTIEELDHLELAGLSNETILSYKSLALRNNEILIGPMVQVNSNNIGIYLFKGFFNEYGKYGMMIGRINLSMVFHSTISDISLGNAGFMSLSDINETYSYFGNKERLIVSTANTNSLAETDYLKGYSLIELQDVSLLVSARLPYSEIDKPIQITFYLLITLSFGLLVIFSIMTIVLYHYKKKENIYFMELKLQEQINQGNRNEVLGLLSRKIAHDYNNLLAPITIYCELLEDSLTDSTALEYVKEIEQSSEQCMLLARDLLAYGKKQPSSVTTRYNSTNTLKDTLKRIQMLHKDHITLKTDITNEPLFLYGQPLEFVQIIYNLCMNSIHAMKKADAQNTSLLITESVRGDGAILVNQSGVRFGDELRTRDVVSASVIEQEGGYAYLIFDQQLRDELSAVEKYIENDIVTQAETLEELATALEMDPATLTETVTRWNEAVASQNDEEFGRDTGMEHDISVGPFYAIKIAPGVHHTMGGLEINTNAEVISTEGTPISGLFAAGEVAGGVHGGNRIGGTAVTDIVVFGRIAGMSATEYVNNLK